MSVTTLPVPPSVAVKDAHVATTVVPGPEHATPHFKTHTGVEPEKALGWLKNGNTRFIKGYVRRDGQSKKDIARWCSHNTLIPSCSRAATLAFRRNSCLIKNWAKFLSCARRVRPSMTTS